MGAISGLYSSVAERQSCKLKVLGSIPSGGLFLRAGVSALSLRREHGPRICIYMFIYVSAGWAQRISSEQGSLIGRPINRQACGYYLDTHIRKAPANISVPTQVQRVAEHAGIHKNICTYIYIYIYIYTYIYI